MFTISMRSNILIYLLIFLAFSSYSQVNIMGKPGYMQIPSANWLEDQHLGLSFAYIPSRYSKDIFISINSSPEGNTILMYGINAKLISFIEISANLAYRPSVSDVAGIGERHLDFRFLILKERNYLPGIVLSVTPPGSVSPTLANDYLVMTKKIELELGKFELSLGYGSPYVFLRKNHKNGIASSLQLVKKTDTYGSRYLSGVFGGFSYMPLNFVGVMAEYNTHTVNTGVFLKIKEKLQVQGYLVDGKDFSFNLAMNFSLDISPKSLRKYEKSLD